MVSELRVMNWTNSQSTLLATLIEQPRLGVITDVDGTISPIVSEPDAAAVTPLARSLLAALREHVTVVAAVSGRAAPDIYERIGLDGLVYVGNHGMERWRDGAAQIDEQIRLYRSNIESALEQLRALTMQGLFIEDKVATLTLHYRNTADPDAAAETLTPIVQATADANGLRLVQGRRVFELRPPVEIHKGTAFQSLITEYALDGAVYIGDDTTDVDALHAARQLRERGSHFTLGIGVQDAGTPQEVLEAADISVEGVAGVESLLRWLLDARIEWERSASST